jgi:hypothetical protein
MTTYNHVDYTTHQIQHIHDLITELRNEIILLRHLISTFNIINASLTQDELYRAFLCSSYYVDRVELNLALDRIVKLAHGFPQNLSLKKDIDKIQIYIYRALHQTYEDL